MAAASPRAALVALVTAALGGGAGAAAPPAPPGLLAFGAPGEVAGVIVQVDTRGRAQRIIRRGGASEPVFSRDGRRLAYLISLNELWVARADGSDARRVTRVRGETMSRPTWSPDGQRLAYVGPAPAAASERRFGLWIVNVATRRGHRVRTLPAAAEPDWSPDGRWFAYAAADGLRLLSVDGRRTRMVAREVGTVPRWSPGGRWIAFQTVAQTLTGYTVSVRVVAPGNGRLRTLATSAAPGSATGPLTWAPDGSWLAYTTPYEETAIDDDILFELRTVRLRDGASRLILDTGLTDLYGLAWLR